jgi:flavin-dependent dehydrogenase
VADWFDFDFTPAIAQTVRQIRYTWKLVEEVTGELETAAPLWIVRRDEFDYFLVQQAIAQGVTLQDQTPATGITFQGDRWQVQTPAGAVVGRYLVAADGATGSTTQWLGLGTAPARPAALWAVACPPSPFAPKLNFEFGLLKNGCLWNFPHDTGHTIGATTFIGKPPSTLQDAIADYAQAFGLDVASGAYYEHPVRLWDGFRPLHTQHALVVGEAGALVDPLSAEGIRPGLYSGWQAALAIHAALQGEATALEHYTTTMQAWGRNMQWAQRIANLFFRVPGIGYRVGIKRPTMTTRLGQILTGELQYSDIANRIIKRLSTGVLPGAKN